MENFLAIASRVSYWRPQHLANLVLDESAIAPVIRPGDGFMLDGLLLWDPCPILNAQRHIARVQGGELWLALSAPVTAVGVTRHEQARLRLLTRCNGNWCDAGNLLPDGFSSGSREWAGMAYLNDEGELRLYYTATGEAGETSISFIQRIFVATARLEIESALPVFGQWQDQGEIIQADGEVYLPANELQGEAGVVRAFRDPFVFSDPKGGHLYMLFSASYGLARSARNGAIGVALKDAAGHWQLQPVLIDCDGVSNEMERPHIVYHGGLYYLFWSTNSWTFAADIDAPSGLYGMCAENFLGPYEPMNGSGLVAANPLTQPYQAYSWWVSDDLSVASFVDMPDGVADKKPGSPVQPEGHFEGAIAPEFHLQLKGLQSCIIDKEA